MAQNILTQRIEDVSLVLGEIGGLFEKKTPGVRIALYAGVMPGDDTAQIAGACGGEKQGEFERAVALNAGVGREPRLVAFNKAADKLYLSQPSLTSAVKELEKEIGVTIFNRSGRGVTLTAEGMNFLPYARQVYSQYQNLLDAYSKQGQRKRQFAVSTQHYSFAVNAFFTLFPFNQSISSIIFVLFLYKAFSASNTA